MNLFHFLQPWKFPQHNPESERHTNPAHPHEPVESCEYLDEPLRNHEQPFLEPEPDEL